MKASLSALLLATLTGASIPLASACEDPEDIVIALRDTVPAVMASGEVVLELDRAGMEIIKAREDVIKLDKPATVYPTGEPGLTEMRYDVSYATSPVVRVVHGDFAEPFARINVSLWSTCEFISGPQGRFLVGRPATDREGISYVVPRWIKSTELLVRHDEDRGATY